MKLELLERLRCPATGRALKVEGHAGTEVENGWLVTDDGAQRYPIRNGIPRFVPESNYADNFGTQWNYFRRTQLDSHSGHPISAERFWKSTGWRPEELKDQWVLDAGCGSGRFAEVALNAGAKLVAIDLSSAVDACYANLRHHKNLHVVQANIYELPFAPESFPFVYSLGVLQHTPDVERAFASLPKLLQPGGRMCVDYYPKTWTNNFRADYLLRPITTRMPQSTLFNGLKKTLPVLLPISRGLGSIPGVGRALKRIVPVINYHGELPLSSEQHQEWSLLDTFDVLAPKYDQPQTAATARRWMEAAGMKDVEAFRSGLVIARGRK
jgi:2-polyprenyl-3-methyl-5-hydroxy-6-metoxy-1,4-benzoquinol methylase/uncharacterized protein YbaR (Trm112 family)